MHITTYKQLAELIQAHVIPEYYSLLVTLREPLALASKLYSQKTVAKDMGMSQAVYSLFIKHTKDLEPSSNFNIEEVITYDDQLPACEDTRTWAGTNNNIDPEAILKDILKDL